MCQKTRCQLFMASVLMAIGLPALTAESRLTFREIVSEQVDPAMPVTAVAAVGLALASSTSPESHPAKPATIWIRVPAELVGVVTVRVTAIDGRYVATLKFDANGGPQRWEQIALSSTIERRDAILKDYARHQLAYAVSIAETAKATSADVWLPVASEDPTNGAGMKTAVLLNAAGAETVFFRFPGAQKRVVCKAIGGQRARHFNTACELTLNEMLLLASPPGAPLTIRRARGTEFLDPVVLTLR